MDPVIAAIDEALVRAGLSDAAASKLAVGNHSLIKNMRADRGAEKRYSFQSLQELARVLGLECYFGPKRELLGFAQDGSGSDLGQKNAFRAGHLPIPWLDSSTRAGSSPFSIDQSWLASNGLAPDHLRAVELQQVHLPFPFDEKPVAVIDTVAARKGSTGIWAFRDEGKIAVSRAAFDAEVTVLFPGGDDGPIRIVKRAAPEPAILGRVVWIGGRTP